MATAAFASPARADAQPATTALRPSRSLSPVLRRCSCGGKSQGGGECAECKKKRLQRKATAAGPSAVGPALAPASVHAVLGSAGRPLAPEVRARMESRLGHDLGNVRVHDDPLAARSAAEVSALAWTVGERIAFASGQYRPNTSAGERLLAHELTHTLQGSAYSSAGAIPIGRVDDLEEREADRVADRAVSAAPTSSLFRRPVLRRQPNLDPAPAEQSESAPAQMASWTISDGPPPVMIDVVRRFERCPCRNVRDARDGVFYDAQRDRVAIAYRYCEGRTTTDVYAEAQGDPQRVLSGQVPITGARIGVEINVAPHRGEGGRIILEGIGDRPDAQTSVGGRVLLVYENRGWRIFADAQYQRRLGELNAGQVPDDVDVSLGGQWGRVRARVQLTNLAGGGTGVNFEGCVDLGIGAHLCGNVGTGPAGPTGTIDLRVPFDIPGGGRPERCFQCYCPPAKPVYECHRYTFPWIEDQPITIDVEEQHEFRYYFRLDRDTPSEDSALRAQSDANLATLQQRIQNDGAQIMDVIGFTSPEATERHNNELSERRGRRLRDVLTARLGTSVTVPESRGAGELLGSRPTPSPSSRLGDVIHDHGFRRAEDLTVLLLGEEIPNQELADQFLSLFNSLTDPTDRLTLFGLTDADPIAPQVLATVDRFIASRGRGHRPWERVFRLLRVGVARLSWTEQRQTTQEVHRGSTRVPVTGAECDQYAAEAEAEHRFPRINPQDLIARVDRHERNEECRDTPTGREGRECDYTVPAILRAPRPLTAPARAPRRF